MLIQNNVLTPEQATNQAGQMAVIQSELAQTIVRQASLQGQMASLESQLPSASGSHAGVLREQLVQVKGELDGTNAKIAALKAQLAEVEGKAPTVTEIVPVPPPVFPPEERMFNLTKDEFKGAFSFLLLFPLVLAVAWRMVRTKKAPPAKGALEADRLQRLEQAVESVAIEVERIGESQRFQAKLMAEKQPVSSSDSR